MATKQAICEALRQFIKQRPGLEFANYGDHKAYFAEMRSITKDRHHAETLLAAVERKNYVTAQHLTDGFRAYSGRLSMHERDDGKIVLDYCAGQYLPTEYRRAVCAVLAAALWDAARDDYKDGNSLRTYFRKEYGRHIASRWFN